MSDSQGGVTPSPEDSSLHSLAVDVRKRLGDFQLQVQFAVGRELLVLFGHSGSGKSLTLRAIAGLMRPDSGRIEIGGAPVYDSQRKIEIGPQRRGVGMVVQNYALFPHLTVRENVAFGLHGWAPKEQRRRVDELLELLDIHSLSGRRPATISGGQAQRVALARALAPRPKLLLLDEPFSALDSAIRVNLRRELVRLKRELDLTIVFVTHDLREAYNLADKIAVVDGGRILQVGPRDEVFNQPVSGRAAQLTEVRNIWQGVVKARDAEGLLVDTGRMLLRAPAMAFSEGERVDVCIRPERITLLRQDRPHTEHVRDSIVTGEIVDEVAHGASHTLYFRLAEELPARGHDIEVEIAAHPYEVMGVEHQRVWSLAFPREALHVMPVRLS